MDRANEKTVRKPSVRYQLLTAFVAGISNFCFGIACGWPSPNIITLMSDETPLPSGKITLDEASSMTSLLYVSGGFGNLFLGYISNHFGRKKPMIFNAFPIILGWLLLLFAQNVYYLYAARILMRFFNGGVLVIMNSFLTEIASDHIRGFMCATVILTSNMGTFLALALGNYCNYSTTPICTIVLFCIYALFLSFSPESPIVLMKQNKISEAEKSICFYRNLHKKDDNDLVLLEIEKLKCIIESSLKSSEKQSLKLSDFNTKQARKAIAIGVLLLVMHECSGSYAISVYAGTIFNESGSNLTPNTSAMVVGAIQFIGILISVNMVDRWGRKVLMSASMIGSALGLMIFGTYMTLKTLGYEVEAFNFIPLASFAFVMFMASWGILTLTTVIFIELAPEKIKIVLVAFHSASMWFLVSIMTKILPFIIEALGMHISMFLFSALGLLSTIVFILFVPEMKGKSYEEIMEILR